MLYIYPSLTLGSVSLRHYNLYAYKEQADEHLVKNQRSGFGGSLGIGYEYMYLNLGANFGVFYTSQRSNYRVGNSNAYADRTLEHTLLNYLIQIPIGLSYPLSSQFSLYLGIKPIIGFSNLKWYDSVYAYLDLGFGQAISISWQDASLSKSSVGIGLELGGDFKFSPKTGLFLRFGYDYLSFSEYEGEQELREPDGTIQKRLAFLVFDYDDSTLKIKDKLPDPSKGETWGVEDLRGVRFSFGIKFYL